MAAVNKSLTGVERKMDRDEIIVTKTDLDGKMRYCNRTFYKYGDYAPKECIGVQHNLIRHPEMPRTVFDLLWKTIKGGDEIFAYVKNRSKNGDHYWVLAHVTPSRDGSGSIIGYHSNRRAPKADVLNNHIIPLYDELLKIEARSSSPKMALVDGSKKIEDLLSGKSMKFNQFIFSMGA